MLHCMLMAVTIVSNSKEVSNVEIRFKKSCQQMMFPSFSGLKLNSVAAGCSCVFNGWEKGADLLI